MTNPSTTQQNISLGLAIALTLVVAVYAYKTQGVTESEYRPQQVQAQQDNVCDVHVLTIDFGNGPNLLWSNSKATQTKDGAITIQLPSESDL